MKVLIVSDTHRKNDNFIRVLEQEAPVDMVVHCGDAEGCEELIFSHALCQVEIVAGNNDFFSPLPKERQFKIGKYNVWLTHGHNYYVSMDNEMIKQEAMARGADIVMYGHTHRPVVDQGKDMIAINPGSLSYPRQEGKRPSYVTMETAKDGEVHFLIHYL